MPATAAVGVRTASMTIDISSTLLPFHPSMKRAARLSSNPGWPELRRARHFQAAALTAERSGDLSTPDSCRNGVTQTPDRRAAIATGRTSGTCHGFGRATRLASRRSGYWFDDDLLTTDGSIGLG